MYNSIILVPFHSQTLSAVLVNNLPFVAMKPICESIGIDWEGQRQKIMRHPVLNSVACMIKATAEDGKSYDMLMLPIKHLNGWLFGIDSSRVKPEAKDLVIEYQKECFDVLANHFMPKPQYGLKELPEPPMITTAQQGELFTRVKSICGTSGKIRAAVWSRFQNHFHLNSYKHLPFEQYDDSLVYMDKLKYEYSNGIELITLTTAELDTMVADRLAAFEGELLPKEKTKGITINFEGDEPQKILVSVGPMGTTITKLLPDEEIIKKGQYYIMAKKDEVSISKLVYDFIPSRFLPIMIEVAGQRLGSLQ